MTPSADRPAIGIRRTPSGWQAYVRLDRQLYTKHFPPDTPLTEMKTWREKKKARNLLRVEEPTRVDGDTLADDCTRYLASVKEMRTYTDRAYRILQWRDALGSNRERKTVTSVEIRQQLERWRGKGLTPGSLNLRRTALMHLWTVLDGKSAPNPVKDVPRYREVPRALRLPTIAQAETAIANVRWDWKVSKTRARLRVLLWTGWPAAQLMHVTPADLQLRRRRALVRGRQKGTGTRDRWLPLLPQAVKALQDMKTAKAFGPFDTSSMHSSLQRACDRAKIPRFRPYDLRHLFLTTVALAAKDDRAVAELAMHSDIRMVRRYTEQSVSPRLKVALATVAKSLK